MVNHPLFPKSWNRLVTTAKDNQVRGITITRAYRANPNDISASSVTVTGNISKPEQIPSTQYSVLLALPLKENKRLIQFCGC